MLIEVVLRSKRAQFFRRLLSVLRIWETFAVFFLRRLWSFLQKLTTFAGKFYGVCGRFGLGCLFAAFPVVFCRIVAYALMSSKT